MNNSEKFKTAFNGLMATELWSMSEKDFLEWLNSGETGEEDENRELAVACTLYIRPYIDETKDETMSRLYCVISDAGLDFQNYNAEMRKL